jgi:hypothetical protein
MKRPFTLWLLIFILLFLAFGGLYGGLAMLLDPSGRSLHLRKTGQKAHVFRRGMNGLVCYIAAICILCLCPTSAILYL